MKAELTSPANFGTAGTVTKGRYQIAPTGLDTVTPAGLANLDVFFGGIPRGGWDPSESAALQAFVANGGGLVLNLNQVGFGDLPAWLSGLGLTLRPTRAFYGPSDCTPGLPDTAPAPSTSIGPPTRSSAERSVASGDLTMYHTANVLTATGSATPRYNVNITDTTTRFAIDGPVGDVNEQPSHRHRADQRGAAITSVAFWDGPVGTGALLGTDSTSRRRLHLERHGHDPRVRTR